jgi:hypothetical protein
MATVFQFASCWEHLHSRFWVVIFLMNLCADAVVKHFVYWNTWLNSDVTEAWHAACLLCERLSFGFATIGLNSPGMMVILILVWARTTCHGTVGTKTYTRSTTEEAAGSSAAKANASTIKHRIACIDKKYTSTIWFRLSCVTFENNSLATETDGKSQRRQPKNIMLPSSNNGGIIHMSYFVFTCKKLLAQ